MKKIKKKWLSSLLAVVMCFTISGCGAKGSFVRSKGVHLDNGKITESSIVVGIGEEGVRYSEIRGYCYLLKKQYAKSFGNALWKYSIGENRTLGDEAKEEILNMVTALKVIGKQAKEEHVTLTTDEKDEAIGQAEKILEAASVEDRKKYCLSEQSLLEIFQSNLLANKMFYIATDDADTEVPEEEARQVSIQYLHLQTNGKNENGVEIKLSEKEKAELKKKAKKLVSSIKKKERFLDIANQYSDDKQTELFVGKGDKTIASEAVSKAMSLKTGEISPVVEGEDGYYIIYCVNENDKDATQAKKEEIISNRQIEMFKTKYSDWLGESEMSISKSFWKIFEI